MRRGWQDSLKKFIALMHLGLSQNRIGADLASGLAGAVRAMDLSRTCRLHHAPRIPPPSLFPRPLLLPPPFRSPPSRRHACALCRLLLPLSFALCASLKQPCYRTRPQDEYTEELLGDDDYAMQFFKALDSDETEAGST